ncbi:MAG: class I SAM-dependent methyltransferase [Gammaproteobacteria bacterium]|nr:MAG: class I SAM-dependent methyltransferase [Gammaproteobacteria bacterium]
MKGSDCPLSGKLPGSAKSAGWTESLLLSQFEKQLADCRGHLELTLPNGNLYSFGVGEPRVSVRLHTYTPLLRLFFGGTNGWSDGYLNGEWDSPNLTELVRWALRNEAALSSMSRVRWINDLLYNLYHWRHRNSRRGSRSNVSAHYNLGNEFYKLWLDPGMTYSAALFQRPDMTLEEAQSEKYQRIIELLEPRENDQVLEIGCGWGEFALQALQRHPLSIHGVTLSTEQLTWAQEKLEQAGLEDRARISLTDYRDINRQYNAVVSIEMFEAVGQEYWDTFFAKLKGVLKPGGRAVLQIITIDDRRFEHYSRQADFIQRHVFPGGMLPSVAKLQEKFDQHGFRLTHRQMFGRDYARTLSHWREQFERQWPKINDMGFDDRFHRLWNYYLCYCEGGFEERAIDVGLFVLEHQRD